MKNTGTTSGRLLPVRAPGRVNLIGEHTDYQEGLVLPCAVDLSLTFTATLRSDGLVRLSSDQVPGVAKFNPGDEPGEIDPPWARYPAAVLLLLMREGLGVPGLDGRISGDLPVMAGLSSSAAICVGTALMALAAARDARREVPEGLSGPVGLADLCRRAEGLAAGVKCGVMDPLAILTAQEGAALLIDCRDLSSRTIPIDGARMSLVVADSGVRRALADGGYNRRREECEEAVGVLGKKGYRLATLRDLDPVDLPGIESVLPDLLYRRARHVVTENARVRAAAAALSEGDVEGFGALLDASHESLRTDFEVSCAELDDLTARARSVHGVLGSRMTGAGFGGMTITAVSPEGVKSLLAALPKASRPTVVSPGPAAEVLLEGRALSRPRHPE